MPTTFDADGTLDEHSQRSLTEAILTWGVDGITALGVMGEVTALGSAERQVVVRAVTEVVAGQVPVAVGCSGAALRMVLHQIAEAADCGAAAAMVSAPPLTRNVDVLPGFYGQIARLGALPVVIQDEPAATGVLIPPSILAASAEAGKAAAVKLEDPPTPRKISALLDLAPGTVVFGGLGGLMAYHELARGAAGTMTGFSFPEVLRALRLALERGDRAGALATYSKFLPLLAFEAQQGVGLSIRKELLLRRGVITSSATRIGPPIDASHQQELDELLKTVGIAPQASRLEL
jgi:4-hydroxy-tetrahydrodipicolinate synthase